MKNSVKVLIATLVLPILSASTTVYAAPLVVKPPTIHIVANTTYTPLTLGGTLVPATQDVTYSLGASILLRENYNLSTLAGFSASLYGYNKAVNYSCQMAQAGPSNPVNVRQVINSINQPYAANTTLTVTFQCP